MNYKSWKNHSLNHNLIQKHFFIYDIIPLNGLWDKTVLCVTYRST